jgi:hypothetical protein
LWQNPSLGESNNAIRRLLPNLQISRSLRCAEGWFIGKS